MRIPSVIDTGKTVESCIESLWCNYRQHVEAKPHAVPLHDSASRYACGYPVPSFQRHLVWTLAQKVAFVESLWLGIYPGTYCIHESDWSRDGTPVPFSGWLIDGQQRLTTIEQYWNDEFPVFGLVWSELTVSEVRRFKSIKYGRKDVSIWDDLHIRDLYNRMAFGGTAHQHHEKA